MSLQSDMSFLLATRRATLAQAHARPHRYLHATTRLYTPPTRTNSNAKNLASTWNGGLETPSASAKDTAASLSSLRHWFHSNGSNKAKWGVAGGALVLGGMYFLSGDDGSSDPVLGRPNPADRVYLASVPTSKLVSGWM